MCVTTVDSPEAPHLYSWVLSTSTQYYQSQGPNFPILPGASHSTRWPYTETGLKELKRPSIQRSLNWRQNWIKIKMREEDLSILKQHFHWALGEQNISCLLQGVHSCNKYHPKWTHAIRSNGIEPGPSVHLALFLWNVKGRKRALDLTNILKQTLLKMGLEAFGPASRWDLSS
jgi:hypothetical protein